MCRSTMRRRRERGAKCVEVLCVEGGKGGGKMCRSTMRRNLHKLTKVFNDVLSKYLKIFKIKSLMICHSLLPW